MAVNLNTKLQAANPMKELGKLSLDNSFTSGVNFTNAVSGYPLKGEWTVTGSASTPPYSCGAMPLNATTADANLMVNEYFLDTFGWALWQSDAIDLEVPMNTSDWKVAIPGLYNAYPDQPMILEIMLNQAANGNFSSKGVELNVQFALDYLVNNGSGEVDVLQMSCTVVFQVDFSLNFTNPQPTLDGKVSTFTVTFKEIASSVGKVETGAFNLALKTLITTIIKPQINKILGAGVPINLPPALANLQPEILFFDGYMAFSVKL